MKEGPRGLNVVNKEKSTILYPINISANTAEVRQIRSVSPPRLVAATGEQLLNNVVANKLPTPLQKTLLLTTDLLILTLLFMQLY